MGEDVQGDIVDEPLRLLVLGAGPKALALAAKARVLERLGFGAPKIIVVDQHKVAAHWTGEHGYTDGRQQLGTPPEKDVGFPYAAGDTWGTWGDHVNEEMLRYSWQAYLASGKAEPKFGYSEWVDRGRPQPTHLQWGRYLEWVADRVELKPETGKVREIGLSGHKWVIKFTDEEPQEIFGDALVVTGPGPASPVCDDQPTDHPLVFDGSNYWLNTETFRALHDPVVCIIGAGETAASIAVSLLDVLPTRSAIDIVVPAGVVYSRGESFDENRRFLDPSEWSELSLDDRRKFVRRTDRAVFSAAAKARLNAAQNVETRRGRVVGIEAKGGEVLVQLAYEGKKHETTVYSYVICATGFDAMWFLDLFTEDARAALERATKGDDVLVGRVEASIESDLSVRDLAPPLHLPMHAAINQGPGFPNLSSLGLLADRILAPYVVPPAESASPSPEEATANETS